MIPPSFVVQRIAPGLHEKISLNRKLRSTLRLSEWNKGINAPVHRARFIRSKIAFLIKCKTNRNFPLRYVHPILLSQPVGFNVVRNFHSAPEKLKPLLVVVSFKYGYTILIFPAVLQDPMFPSLLIPDVNLFEPPKKKVKLETDILNFFSDPFRFRRFSKGNNEGRKAFINWLGRFIYPNRDYVPRSRAGIPPICSIKFETVAV